jgi:exosortase
MRSLVSLLALAVVFACITQRRVSNRCILVLSAVPIALVANACRIWGTGVLAHLYGPQAAEGFYHTFAGWLVFVVAFGLLLGAGGLLSLLQRTWGHTGGGFDNAQA